MEINKKIKVEVIIPARNEEKYLPKTLEALSKQDLKPIKTVLVNDGSTDNTHDIALRYGCEVIDLEDEGISGLGGPKMTKLHEIGLAKLDADIDYVLHLDADMILPTNYISFLVDKMEKNPKLVISSGIPNGIMYKAPMGTGRLIKFKFYKKIGLKRKVKYGVDTYPLWKAYQLGFEYTVFNINTVTRKYAAQYKKSNFILVGKTAKALGYHPKAALLGFIEKGIRLRSIRVIFWQIKGYFSKDVELYDSELRNFVRDTQKKMMYKKIEKILTLNFLRH